MQIKVPELSLILLVGTSGSGKSSFAAKHFRNTEIVSSDECRGIVSNDENSKEATNDAFELLHYIVSKRLKNGLLTVVDATNIQPESRSSLMKLAKEFHTLGIAIVLDIPPSICEKRNKARTDRNLPPHVLRMQTSQMRRSLKSLKKEGFNKIHTLKSEEEVNAVSGIFREKLYNDKKEESGPFDIIGDVHGCFDELVELLETLSYEISERPYDEKFYGYETKADHDRKVIFVGDLADRGPKSPQVLKLVMSMVKNGMAFCVCGNHDAKLQKWLKGKKVNQLHGFDLTIQQLANETEDFKFLLKEFLYSLISHYIFDDGKLVVAHAGITENMIGRASGAIRSFCLYGDTTGEADEHGRPIRLNWALDYRGRAKVVYGHVAIHKAEWVNNTIDIDTGCVFGGNLTALRYPEEELISVAAKETYCEPSSPLEEQSMNPLSIQQESDDLLNIEDVIGKRVIQTRLSNNITIREENSINALEVMSRFALNPKWLIYLPPTMSPCEVSEEETYLEHPLQAINYYLKRGVQKIVCEEKHMGSRVVLVIGKNEQVILERFGIQDEGIGKCFTRTGRNFFTDEKLEKEFLEIVNKELSDAGFWSKFNTDWVCLDCELMPWSAKAQALLKGQYAAVGSAAKNALPVVTQALQSAKNRGIENLDKILQKFQYKEKANTAFVEAYQQYCWEVKSVRDYRLAPFHILATEGKVHVNQSHEWHMENISRLSKGANGLFYKTPYKIIDINEDSSIQNAIDWWMELTKQGGEGMVVKPYNFIEKDNKGLLQPAVKCRGKEYLRIIYGSDYDAPGNLSRLKKRGLSRKRSLALREFALGIEALERFVNKHPLRSVHESVFAVLALESEAVDPRL